MSSVSLVIAGSSGAIAVVLDVASVSQRTT